MNRRTIAFSFAMSVFNALIAKAEMNANQSASPQWPSLSAASDRVDPEASSFDLKVLIVAEAVVGGRVSRF